MFLPILPPPVGGRHARRATALGVALLVACGDGPVTPPVDGPPPARVAALRVLPDSLVIAAGDSAVLIALALDSAGRTVTATPPVYGTADSSIAVATSQGRVRALRGGRTTVRTTIGTVTATTPVVVLDTATRVTVTPASATIAVGATARLHAEARADTGAVAGAVSWTTSAPEVATVAADGTVTAVAAGSATITATVRGGAGSAAITVSPQPVPPPPPPPPPVVATASGRRERGATLRLVLRDAEADTALTSGVSWSILPAGAGTIAGDSLRLGATGVVSVVGRGTIDGRETADTLPLLVAAPPRVAFESVRDGQGELYVVALDGGELARITEDPADDRMAGAGGGAVTFVSSRSGNPELWRQAIGGGAPVRLTSTTGEESLPAPTADGSRLAFVFTPDGGVPRVWTANGDGTGAARLAAADGGTSAALEGRPTWSPDGSRLVYVSTRSGAADLWIADRAGAAGSARRLDTGGTTGVNVDPAWSPDGLSLAFVSTRGGTEELFVYTFASGVARRVAGGGSLGEPAWLPDGRIVFTRWVSGVPQLRWIDPAAPGAETVVPTGGAGQRGAALR